MSNSSKLLKLESEEISSMSFEYAIIFFRFVNGVRGVMSFIWLYSIYNTSSCFNSASGAIFFILLLVRVNSFMFWNVLKNSGLSYSPRTVNCSKFSNCASGVQSKLFGLPPPVPIFIIIDFKFLARPNTCNPSLLDMFTPNSSFILVICNISYSVIFPSSS